MNDLSWIIYLADVAGSINNLAGTLLVFSVPTLAAATAVRFFDNGTGYVYSYDTAEAMASRAERRRSHAATIAKACVRAMIPAAMIAAFLPSKATLYAIAASEMGESVVNSTTGGKAIQALNAWLDRQIAGEPKADAKDPA